MFTSVLLETFSGGRENNMSCVSSLIVDETFFLTVQKLTVKKQVLHLLLPLLLVVHKVRKHVFVVSFQRCCLKRTLSFVPTCACVSFVTAAAVLALSEVTRLLLFTCS